MINAFYTNIISLKMSQELNFILKVLFDRKISNDAIKKLDLDKLIKTASAFLILPLLYKKITKNKLSGYFEKEFMDYLRKIYEINLERNTNLKVELRLISNILIAANIEHVFIKGSSHVIKGIYECAGERMIGDIDILINMHDQLKVKNIFEKNGYYITGTENFIKSRHSKRKIHVGKVFAVEFHDKFDEKNIVNVHDILKNKIMVKGFNVPSDKNDLHCTIYNYMLNDYGYQNLSFSLRSFYDTFLLEKRIKNEIVLFNNKYSRVYFGIAKSLDINFKNKIKAKLKFTEKLRILFKKKFKIYRIFEFCIFKLSKVFNWRIKQFITFIYYPAYRKFVKEKVFSKFC